MEQLTVIKGMQYNRLPISVTDQQGNNIGLLSLYVDDLIFVGTEENHAKIKMAFHFQELKSGPMKKASFEFMETKISTATDQESRHYRRILLTSREISGIQGIVGNDEMGISSEQSH